MRASARAGPRSLPYGTGGGPMQAQTAAPATLFGDDVRVDNGRVTVANEQALRSERMDALVREAVFGQGQARDHARWLIFEIARSEIAYTEQRPAEYVAVMLAAALREGFRGPLFIQGDHFQVNAKKFAADPGPEVDAVKQLATEAIAYGFYNIDVDTSTLVDLSKSSLDEQQRLNYDVGIDILREVRSLEP